MALERMKVKMFKTYENEEAVVFSDFTCIVGPNGAGKSNLVDAMLFALGIDLLHLRGGVECRGGQSGATAAELFYRDSKGLLTSLKRELRGSTSFYTINEEKVTHKEFSAYLEGEWISVQNKNFLISQNEAMVKSPKDLTRFLDDISGSANLKEAYREARETRDTLARRHQTSLEQKRVAEADVRETQELAERGRRHAELTRKKRLQIGSKIRKRQEAITQGKEEALEKLRAIERETGFIDKIPFEKTAGTLQTQIIKARAECTALNTARKAQVAQAEENQEKREQELERLEKKKDALSEKKGEALAQVEECRWQIKKLEEISEEKNDWAEKLKKETLKKAVADIQKLETEKDLRSLRLNLAETMGRLKEAEAQAKALAPEPGLEKAATSEKLARANTQLLDTLRQLSFYNAHQKESSHSSKLAYCVSRLKARMPQIVGRVEDLIRVSSSEYAQALYALISSKRNTVVIDSEHNVLPILHGLTQSGTGRVTVLPLSRIAVPLKTESFVPTGYLRFSEVVVLSSAVKTARDKLIEYICGNTLIYLGQDVPMHVGAKIVTLDGIIISAGGSVRKVTQKPEIREIQSLEGQRDALLEEIRQESIWLKKTAKENLPQPRSAWPEVQALESLYLQQKDDLEEMEEEIRDKKAKIIERAQIDPRLIEQALKQGVFDTKTAEKKIVMIENRVKSWQKNLSDLADALQQTETAITALAQTDSPVSSLPDQAERAQHLQQTIAALEKELLEIADTPQSTAAIELRILREQVVSFGDELEEIEQFIAEEGLAGDSLQILPNGADTDEDIAETEKELLSLVAFFKGKKTAGSDTSAYEKAVKEAEESREALNHATKQFLEVKKERTSLFLQVFDKINSTLTSQYAKLVQPTTNLPPKAHLGLENPAEPYLGGTQIFVMPTGKTFREAKYLSGGEKTMAALALLLSIHAIYPAPFYIFDELDAALDKEKILALRTSLQAVSAQFISVTHRLELFSTADTLIGVAKPPQGYSQVFTLKL
ncbi:structural maintenance of chromosome 1 [Nematocida displodere]|uniref:Structural maintenance of chromosome 1 n=1 Tax=Nematocida displodere TaxID=1805483 RepID=A0A177EI83_9MICR|nr:structural maintenance of chromosome 1 [Nematocida displodere]